MVTGEGTTLSFLECVTQALAPPQTSLRSELAALGNYIVIFRMRHSGARPPQTSLRSILAALGNYIVIFRMRHSGARPTTNLAPPQTSLHTTFIPF